MAACITFAGETLIAQKAAAKQPLSITQFVFANVPGLDTSAPVDRSLLKPPPAQIVHTAAIPSVNAGFVNPNQVVYSAQIGSDVGDWDYNWIGLVTDDDTLFAVSYVPLQQKRRNIPPLQTGNNITRNFLVAFDGAQAITGLTIDATTWQHDFTVRLVGIDQRERLSNRDIYGRAAFFGTALELVKVAGTFQVMPGVAYGEGIRVENGAPVVVNPPSYPTTIWLDCALARELNDVVASWKVVWGDALTDYHDSVATKHYCVPIAHLPNANEITDLRPVLQTGTGVGGVLDQIQAAALKRSALYFFAQI